MKHIHLLFAGLLVMLLTSCTSPIPQGIMYTDMKLPALTTGNKALTQNSGLKVGKATCTSIFGWVATGDASIEQACKNAGITKIYYVDWKVVSEIPLGIKTVYTTIVYGE